MSLRRRFAGGSGGVASAVDPAVVAADLLQEGILLSTDCAITRDTSAQVTIAAAPRLWVKNPSGVLLPVASVQTVLGSIPAATNNRLDQVVVDSGGAITRLAGTSDLAGNTLANRTGAASIPAGSRLLYDMLVKATGIAAVDIRDRRPWARGFFWQTLIATQTLNASASPAIQNIVGTEVRVECTGRPLEFTFGGRVDHNSVWVAYRLWMDGADSTMAEGDQSLGSAPGPNAVHFYGSFVPAAGSHLFELKTSHGGNSLTSTPAGNNPWTVREVMKPPAHNGTT